MGKLPARVTCHKGAQGTFTIIPQQSLGILLDVQRAIRRLIGHRNTSHFVAELSTRATGLGEIARTSRSREAFERQLASGRRSRALIIPMPLREYHNVFGKADELGPRCFIESQQTGFFGVEHGRERAAIPHLIYLTERCLGASRQQARMWEFIWALGRVRCGVARKRTRAAQQCESKVELAKAFQAWAPEDAVLPVRSLLEAAEAKYNGRRAYHESCPLKVLECMYKVAEGLAEFAAAAAAPVPTAKMLKAVGFIRKFKTSTHNARVGVALRVALEALGLASIVACPANWVTLTATVYLPLWLCGKKIETAFAGSDPRYQRRRKFAVDLARYLNRQRGFRKHLLRDISFKGDRRALTGRQATIMKAAIEHCEFGRSLPGAGAMRVPGVTC